MREHPELSEKEAIKLWDQQMDKRVKVRQREVELIREEALHRSETASQAATGKIVTALDSYHILQLLRDMQLESAANREARLEQVVERASVSVSLEQAPPGLSGDALDNFIDGFSNLVESRFKQKQEKQKAEIQHFDKLLDLSKYKYYNKELENRLNPTVLRKIAQVEDIEQQLKYIIDIKSKHGPKNAVFSDGTIVTPFDFLSVYIKAFDTNRLSATHPEWGKDKELYRGFVNGKKAYDALSEQYSIFKDKFKRFLRLTQVDLDVSSFLKNVNLGFEKSPFEGQASEQTLYEEIGLKKLDFSPIIDQFKPYNWKNFSQLKEHQPKIEEFFQLLELSYYLRSGATKQYKPLYEEFERKGEVVEDAKRELDQGSMKLFSSPQKEDKPSTVHAEIFSAIFELSNKASEKK
jgi:hypothetical protein